jgi:hypothetical protein
MKSSLVSINLDKRGISIMIGYILLITSAVVMSAIVYQWMKSYVPKDTIDCPDGVSIFITESSCIENIADNTYELRINIRNNGRFDIGGYFIHATDNETQELATIDLSENLLFGKVSRGAVVFIPGTNKVENYLNPSDEIERVFNSSSKLYSIELIPIRYQVQENKKQLVSCGRAKIIENIDCAPPVVCTPDCTNKDCGDDGCGGSCPDTCILPDVCEVDTCVPKCQNDNQCSGTEVCVNEQCTLCGNSVWVVDGEECDCGTEDCQGSDLGIIDYSQWIGCDSSCQRTGGDCLGEPSVCS